MFLITDSREQLLMFKESIIVKLGVGDYTTNILLNKFHIERKSGEDLYGTIIQGHARFKRELERAAKDNIILPIYVECTRSDFVSKKFPQGWKRKMKPGALSQILNTMQEKYNLEFVWHKNRDEMRDAMILRFIEEEGKIDTEK